MFPALSASLAVIAAGRIPGFSLSLKYADDNSKEKLHGSLALLPVDASQVSSWTNAS